MRAGTWLLALSLPAAVLPGLGHATIWYVDPAGNDASPGSLAQPFKSLFRASWTALPGDTVYARGGVYLPTVTQWLGCSGTASARIKFMAYPGESPVLDGVSLPAGTDLVGIGGDYLDLQGFEIRNSPKIGIGCWGASHLVIRSNLIHDSLLGGIYVGYNSPGTAHDALIDSNIVSHNCLTNSAKSWTGGWPSAIGIQMADEVSVSANLVYDNYGEGIIQLQSNGGWISGNTLHDNFSVELYVDNSRDIRVEKNFAYSALDPAYERFGYPAIGMGTANETYAYQNPDDGNQFVNNLILNGRYGFYYGDYQQGGGLKNCLVANNTFYNCPDQAIEIDASAGHSNSLVADNISVKAAGIGLAQVAPSAGITFTHNLWFGAGAGAAAGVGDVNADPGLVFPGGGAAADYRLSSTASVAHAAGSSLSAVADDYFNAVRPSAPDLGFAQVTPAPLPSDTPVPLGALGILALRPVPDPQSGAGALTLAVQFSGAVLRVRLQMFSLAMTKIADTSLSGNWGPGWQGLRIPLPPMANGTYLLKLRAYNAQGAEAQSPTTWLRVVR